MKESLNLAVCKVLKKCGDNLVCVPSGRITANQIIHAMIAYKEKLTEFKLSWEMSISELILKPSKVGLKRNLILFRDELNNMRSNFDKKSRGLIVSNLTV